MGSSACNSALRQLDEALALLEIIEKHLGELSVERGASRGPLYGMYTSITRLFDKLAELRRSIIDLCSLEEK